MASAKIIGALGGIAALFVVAFLDVSPFWAFLSVPIGAVVMWQLRKP